MRAYYNMPIEDFTAQLREIAIRANASPLIIDKIDELDDGLTQDEVDEQINKAVEEAEEKAFDDGKVEGEANVERATRAAAKEMYDDCIAAIEAKGVEIGLTEEQVYKVVNHILWDCRP